MGKRIMTQRRGRGTSLFQAHTFRAMGPVKYLPLGKVLTGKVLDLVHCPMHSAPLAEIKYDNGEMHYHFASEGMTVGDIIQFGSNIAKSGNILQLNDVPAGSLVFNLEIRPGDGGKLVRSSGTFAKVVAKIEGNKVIIMLPSKKQKIFDGRCRVTIGTVAGGGRLEKPFLKGGKRNYAMKARGRLHPQVSGVAMNAFEHPFGSGRGRHAGKPKSAPRFAPPGRNVGHIHSKRTGRKK